MNTEMLVIKGYLSEMPEEHQEKFQSYLENLENTYKELSSEEDKITFSLALSFLFLKITEEL